MQFDTDLQDLAAILGDRFMTIEEAIERVKADAEIDDPIGELLDRTDPPPLGYYRAYSEMEQRDPDYVYDSVRFIGRAIGISDGVTTLTDYELDAALGWASNNL